MVADGHPGVAQQLASLLEDTFDVVATVRDGVQLVDAAKRLRPEVIITDLSMPGLSGFQALRQLQDAGVDSPVIFLTMHAELETAEEALRAGACGFVLKLAAGEELIPAIQQVLQGGVFLSAKIARGVARTRPAQ